MTRAAVILLGVAASVRRRASAEAMAAALARSAEAAVVKPGACDRRRRRRTPSCSSTARASRTGKPQGRARELEGRRGLHGSRAGNRRHPDARRLRRLPAARRVARAHAAVKGESQERGNSGVFSWGTTRSRFSTPTRTSPTPTARPPRSTDSARRSSTRPAPGEWQTYDIVFHRPRFDAEGRLASAGALHRLPQRCCSCRTT